MDAGHLPMGLLEELLLEILLLLQGVQLLQGILEILDGDAAAWVEIMIKTKRMQTGGMRTGPSCVGSFPL